MAEKPEDKSFVNVKAVRTLTKVLQESDLTELEYQEGETRIRVVRNNASQVLAPPLMPPPGGVVQPQAAAPAAPSSEPETSGVAVTSPMVGTVYIAPEPGAAPYVRVGDEVREGQTLFIVEAMKVMNPIRSPQSGKVAKICVSDASPVEFGEALLYLA